MKWQHTGEQGGLRVLVGLTGRYIVTVWERGSAQCAAVDIDTETARALTATMAQALHIESTITIKCPRCEGAGHLVPLAAPGLIACSACQGEGHITGEPTC